MRAILCRVCSIIQRLLRRLANIRSVVLAGWAYAPFFTLKTILGNQSFEVFHFPNAIYPAPRLSVLGNPKRVSP
jgi:hypothetical protein